MIDLVYPLELTEGEHATLLTLAENESVNPEGVRLARRRAVRPAGETPSCAGCRDRQPHRPRSHDPRGDRRHRRMSGYGLTYGQRCEAWCWSRPKSGDRALRRCANSAQGYEPTHEAWLCGLHSRKESVCLSRDEALRERRVREAIIRQRNRLKNRRAAVSSGSKGDDGA